MNMNNWPADRVERRSIDALVANATNARTHSEEQIAQIADSMREWGWTNPILVDEAGVIIAGHGRVLAAKKLDWSEAPVMVARGWTEAQKRAYGLADNLLPLNASWDDEKLFGELRSLKEWGFDGKRFGFDHFNEIASDDEPLEIMELSTHEVQDRFWINIRGPLKDQAIALHRLRESMNDLPNIEVKIGTFEVE